jgi:hypothetical protein
MQTFETLEFYRGLVAKVNGANVPCVYQVNKNRQPRNTPIEKHAAADDWFLGRFGTRYRSGSIFVTSDHFVAQQYAGESARVVRVVLLTVYKYCWSPKIRDLFLQLSAVSVPDIPAFLDDAHYIEANLGDAHTSGNEVMLWCERYVGIPFDAVVKRSSAKLIVST